jgi:hypothetical protein
MADLASILKDPNYVNANEATKAAIFDKWAPQDPNFANANAATQSAIRAKFGVAAPVAAEPSTYSKVRDFVTPTVEALGAVGGGAAGSLGGPLGAVAGAGLGYAGAKELLKFADTLAGEGGPKESMAQAGVRQAKTALEGATMEAGGRVIGQGLGYVAGKIADMRQIPQQKAAEIARNALGPDLDKVKNALAQAPAGVTAGQATAGLNSPTWQALMERASKRDPRFMEALKESQGEVSLNALSKLAGGTTATEARGTTEAAKNALNTITTPMRESALSRANLGKAVAEYEAKAGKLSADATAKVADVRRLVNAGDLAEASARLDLIKQGRPVGATQYTYKGELAQMADDWASKAADASLDLGQGARFAQGAADAMRSVGIKPLEGETLARSISGIANKPEFAGNDLLAGAAKNVAQDIAKWTGSGGVVDAKALDAIRKNSVNATIQQLRPGVDATTQRNLAAGVLSKIKPVLDDAIEAAGGEGYKQYLADYAKGMQRIAEKKLSGEALTMFKTNPDAFVKLVQGESPEAVEKILGPGKYDIAKEVSENTLATLQDQASKVVRDIKMGKEVTAGQDALKELLLQQISKMRLPSYLSAVASTTNKALQILEDKIGKNTMDVLTKASQTPQGAAELLDTLSGAERTRVAKILSNPQEWTPGAAAVAVNALKPEQKPANKNSLRIELRGMANKE